MKALIVVDLQNDFLEGGNLAVPKGNEIIPIINDIQTNFDIVVATQDWHPINHKSFASQHQDKNTFDIISLNGLEQVLWPNHCVQGTLGADFSKDWNSNNVAAIFRKGLDIEIDSYSGFFDNGKRKNTGLAAYLKGLNVKDVYLAGLAADYCVYYSAIDAVEQGFNTYFLNFATKPISELDLNKAKEIMVSKGIKVIERKEDL